VQLKRAKVELNFSIESFEIFKRNLSKRLIYIGKTIGKDMSRNDTRILLVVVQPRSQGK
jgi:hypothetical protein